MAIAHSAVPVADVRRSFLTGALVVLFWALAAALIAVCEAGLDAQPPAARGATAVLLIVIASYAYTHVCARCAGIGHALTVGTTWLVLSVLAEMMIDRRIGHAWYGLTGAPGHPLLRDLLPFVWIFAPALFARRSPEAAGE